MPHRTRTIARLAALLATAAACSDTTESSADGHGGSADADSGNTTTSGSTTIEVTGTIDCTFDIRTSMSPIIATVGIVEWAVDLPGVERAELHFGLDTAYGMIAPVDLTPVGEGYRTLLLGMKPQRDYHFRVVVVAGAEICESDDHVVTTGVPPNGELPEVTVEAHNPAARAPGFKVLSDWADGHAFILDGDHEYVWWYTMGADPEVSPDVSRARMSYDGKSMWMRNVNLSSGPRQGKSTVVRVSMDGLDRQAFTMPNGHHDFTVTPDNGIAYIVHDGEGCDQVIEQDALGNLRVVYDLRDSVMPVFEGGQTDCHSNSIHYNLFDDSYTISSLNYDMYTKITRGGQLVWRLGGAHSTYSGDGAAWDRQHGHHNLSADRMLFFNNGELGLWSTAVEIQLEGTTARRVWEYTSENASIVFGDVQRLPNGNTLVTYSDKGLLHEVDPDGALVQVTRFSLGTAVAYVNHRPSLYGPPPK